jgi:hypothetical protein
VRHPLAPANAGVHIASRWFLVEGV